MPTIFRDKVTVGALTFNDPLALPVPPSGVVVDWGLDVLLGWHDTPEMEAEFAPKGLVDGEVPAEFFPVRGRQLTVGGYANADSRAAAEELWDMIVRDAFPRNVELSLTRYETVPKTLRGWRNGSIQPSWTGPMAFRWGVNFRAPDPFKYALTPLSGTAGVAGVATGGRTYPRTYPMTYTSTSSGESNSVTINMTGTATSPRIMIEIDGPVTRGGWRISNDTTGDLLKLDLGLGLGDTLLIDFEKELFFVNGVLASASVTGDFFRLATGVNVLRMYADFDANAQFTVTVYPAWE